MHFYVLVTLPKKEPKKGDNQQEQKPKHKCDKEIEISTSEGYLANIVTEKKQFGSEKCPWVIQVQPGQTINLTLYDFMVANRYTSGQAHRKAEAGERFCQVRILSSIEFHYEISFL